MSERTIPDVWDVFAKQRMPIRRNSWQKMQVQLNEEEKTVTDLFSDLHIHANAGGGAEDGLHLSEDENDAIKSKHQRHSIKRYARNIIRSQSQLGFFFKVNHGPVIPAVLRST